MLIKLYFFSGSQVKYSLLRTTEIQQKNPARLHKTSKSVTTHSQYPTAQIPSLLADTPRRYFERVLGCKIYTSNYKGQKWKQVENTTTPLNRTLVGKLPNLGVRIDVC